MYSKNSYVQRNRIISFTVLFAIVIIFSLYYFITHPDVDDVLYITSSTTVRSSLTDDSRSKSFDALRSPTFIYSLDNQCQTDLNNSSSDNERQAEFNRIYDIKRWGDFGSRSGAGSTIEGAFDWIRHLRSFFERYPIRSVADIPCGDTYWQFSLRELNTIDGLYFGGDISTNVIRLNQQLYGSTHRNKLFQYWDLVRCPIPTYTYRNSTHKIPGNQFDLIIVRDALQHMHIKNGLKAVKHVVRSGAKFFALTSYPPNGQASASNRRSIERNEPLPPLPSDCQTKNYCEMGQIKDGDYYTNNINCYPFNFPLNKAIILQPSHEKFPMESDEIHIYPIDDELKQIVEQYDHACSDKY